MSAHIWKKHKAECLFVHMITNFTHSDPGEYLEGLLAAFPDQQIVAGGPAFKEVTVTSPRLRLLLSLEEMLAFATA